MLPGILARRLELGFLGPDPAVDVGGGFVGTRFAEALSWHHRELRRAWEGRVLAPTRHRRLSRQPWWGLSLHPSLVRTDREARERVLCEEAGRVGVVSRQSSDPSTSSRCSD